MTGTTRAERMGMPQASRAIRMLTEVRGGCIRPVQMRRTSTDDGTVSYVMIPCGATLESMCPACADRAKSLRAEQCRDGWHLEQEPVIAPPAPDETQEYWLTLRAEAQARRDALALVGADTTDFDELITELDDEMTRAGIRGKLNTGTGTDDADKPKTRRARSTRRRQDAAKLPCKPISARTTGKVYTAPDGKTFRPSMFLTLTCPGYGRVKEDGTPVKPETYDYQQAARDALHFAALVDRFIQNLRRYLGVDVQYFAAVEPQKRLAPHLHLAIRGSISRADLRQVIAATYHQVWWPPTGKICFGNDNLPAWHEASGRYVDPATGELTPGWDDALDAIGPGDQPLHVAQFGPMFDAQGVLAGSPDSQRCIRYLTKYLTKQISGCHDAKSDAEHDHADRLVQALRYEPCSPTCANWLRYGVTPKKARPGLVPGQCKGKAHRRDNLGYAGRRVLVSRKWSGKTLADHRADRKAWLVAMLDLPATEPARYRWERVSPGDRDCWNPTRRLLHVLEERTRWQAALTEARRRAQEQADNEASAMRKAA